MISTSSYQKFLEELGSISILSLTELKVEIYSPGHGPHTRRPESNKKEQFGIADMKDLIAHCRTSYGSKDNWDCQRAANCLEEMIKRHVGK